MEDRVFAAALAGLVRDIGKIAERAGENGSRPWNAQAQADFGDKQALLTSDFIEAYIPDGWKEAVKQAASNRHHPRTRLDDALALAGRLSAGESGEVEGSSSGQPKQLLSIFCDVTADERKAPQKAYLPLGPLELKREGLFPGPGWEDARVDQAYRKIWSELTHAARALKQAYQNAANPELYLENWLLLLQRYAWSVPTADDKDKPDVSLYDRSRMTAALAAVLVDSSLSDPELGALSQASQKAGQPLALLVGGDLSGVQAFIYTITARGATSALRGRSFYLQLLTEALARNVLRQLDLPLTNLIYAGGANFYLLARPEDAARLPEVQKAISQTLFYHHRGDLYLALGEIPLAGPDFYKGKISERWGELGRRLEQSKQRRFVELGAEVAHLFEPQGDGGNQDKQCQVCGVEHPDTKADERSTSADGEGKIRKCPNCFGFEALGNELREANFLALEHSERRTPPALEKMGAPGTWQEVLASLGMQARVLTTGELPQYRPTIPTTLLALEDRGLAALLPRITANMAVGRRLLVNVTPILREEDLRKLSEKGLSDLPGAGSIMPFHALAAQSDGIDRLGVVRMDVDNLGRLFSEGLGKSATLARVASLSLAVSLYFEGWVEFLAEESNQRDREAGIGDRLYSIYSGGDDLFFVGAWDAVVELARRIRIDLRDYAAGHPGIHASGGITLVSGKYPLAQAATDAAEAEKQAKAFIRGKDRVKDAICFLGQTIDWEHFGLEACEQVGLQSAHGLMHLLLEHKGPTQTPLIRRLIGLHERYREAKEKRAAAGEDHGRSGQPQILWGPWNWLADYSLKRLYNRNEQEKYIEDLRKELKEGHFDSIEWVGLAARWAELRLR
jgi:CRISPR-associated protein Csm1